jgi:hypothetical protein
MSRTIGGIENCILGLYCDGLSRGLTLHLASLWQGGKEVGEPVTGYKKKLLEDAVATHLAK